MIVAFIFAILSPLFWAMTNVIDKYIVSHRIKNPLSYGVMWGALQIIVGIILACFIPWNGMTPSDMIWPCLAGIIYAINTYLYFFVISKEDISKVIGLLYIYPLITVMLAFTILNERVPLIGYVGMACTILGAVFLSFRVKGLQRKTILLLIFCMALLVGTQAFLVKVTTNSIPPLNGLVIETVTVGILMMGAMANAKIRRQAIADIRKIGWVCIGMVEFLGMTCSYYAMAGLPATIVESIATIQPLIVLLFERAITIFGKSSRISKEHLLLPKLIPILIIILGVVLITIAGNG